MRRIAFLHSWLKMKINLLWKPNQRKMGNKYPDITLSNLNPTKVKAPLHLNLMSFTHHLISFTPYLFNNPSKAQLTMNSCLIMQAN